MTLEEIKKSLTDEQIIDYLKHLGSRHRINNNNPNEIIFQTRCHHKKSEEMKYKLYYYKSSQSFYCYSSCGAIGDIFWLTGHILGVNLSEATKYVLKYFNISNTSPQPYTEEDFEFDFSYEEEVTFQSVKLEDIEVEELSPIKNQNIMRLFIRYYCKEWLNEGISKESMNKYGVTYSIERNAIVIPHYNYNSNEIIGIRCRNLSQCEIENFGKYTPLFLHNKMYNHKLGNNLYGLSHTKDAINRSKKVIIYEGEKSILKMDSIYGDNNCSVAVCGSSFSRYQMAMLLNICDIEEFIIAFDKQWKQGNEVEENKWRTKIERMCKPLLENGKRVSVIWDRNNLLEHKSSPIDRGKQVFEILLKYREELILKEDK